MSLLLFYGKYHAERQTASLEGGDLSVRIRRLLIESMTEQRGRGHKKQKKVSTPLPVEYSNVRSY